MPRNAIIGLIATLIVLAVGGWWVLSPNQQPASSQPTPAVQTPTSATSTQSGSPLDMMEVVVEGNEYKFSPGTLNLASGQKVRLTFKNMGKLPHNLLIDDLGVATKTIGVGKEEMIEFTATKTGTFQMYCSVGDHRARGMEGNVRVK